MFHTYVSKSKDSYNKFTIYVVLNGDYKLGEMIAQKPSIAELPLDLDRHPI